MRDLEISRFEDFVSSGDGSFVPSRAEPYNESSAKSSYFFVTQ